MTEKKRFLSDGVFMLVMLVSAYCVNMALKMVYKTETMIPMIFVLGVFIVSWKTQGYFWGVVDSFLSVLAVNYAFTYPYYEFDLITPECLSSAIVMLIVAFLTGMMTTQVKKQEQMKAEAEKERMRGNLLRAVSHDLRTPLTAIYGSCTAMLDNYDEVSDEQRKKLLTDMCTEAKWLVRMVENLLSITRVDAEHVRLAKKDTVLEELIDAVLIKFQKHFPDQSVTVDIPDEFISIPMDAMLIEQVLVNLLENAVDHAIGMEHLELCVQISGKEAVFRVIDDGCGIARDKIDHLFLGMPEKTHDADKNRRNMGIGLSVCNAIVRAHGGTIRAFNRREGGAEFVFTLKMEEDSSGEQ